MDSRDLVGLVDPIDIPSVFFESFWAENLNQKNVGAQVSRSDRR